MFFYSYEDELFELVLPDYVSFKSDVFLYEDNFPSRRGFTKWQAKVALLIV